MDDITLLAVIGGIAGAAIMGAFIWYLTRVARKMETQTASGVILERTSAPQRREPAPVYTVAPRPAAAPVVETTPTGPQPVQFNAVWHHIGKAIHLLIVGETHSGKSTSARAVLTGRIQAGEDIVILDPHGTPVNWGGIRAVGAGRDYAAIETAMAELLAEMTRRYGYLANDANYTPRPMSIFVDEWPGIQTACKKTAAQFITELAQEGRKAGMRLVMLTQSDLVASLGIEGKGDVRGNFLMLLLGSKASARADVSGLPWPAALRRGENEARPAITDQLEAYSDSLPAAVATMRDGQLWNLKSVKPAPMKQAEPVDIDENLDPLWQRFLNGQPLIDDEIVTSDETAPGPISEQNQLSSPVIETAVSPEYTSGKPVIDNLPDDEQSKAIRLLVHGGISRNKTINLLSLPGTRVEQLKRIKQALGEVE